MNYSAAPIRSGSSWTERFRHHATRRGIFRTAGVGTLAGVVLPQVLTSPAAAAPDSKGAPTVVTGMQDIARWNEGPGIRYRIPALTVAPDGNLLAIFDARPDMNDVPSPITLVQRRSQDNGATWGPLETIREAQGRRGYGDPSVVVDRDTGRIFCFYAASVDTGYASSAPGNNHDDPRILQVDLSVSDDNGATWTHRRVTSQVKDPSWHGIFASSGEGVQLRHGPFAGRLLQQFVVRSSGLNWAMTAYSDDHGETWHRGELVGPGADENKVVELSDGRVLLNIRASGSRMNAISTDGGKTYTDPVRDPQQVDPGCNGSISRVYPDATPDDPRSRIILLVNAEDPAIRRNVTAKLSFDDGRTWPGSVVIEPGSSAYATATPLGGGRMAILLEREGYSTISHCILDTERMGALPAPMVAPEAVAVTAGRSTEFILTVYNQGRSAVPRGTLTVSGPEGWPISTARVGAIRPGSSTRVPVSIEIPGGIAGPYDLHAVLSTRGGAGARESRLRVPVQVERRSGDADRAAIRMDPWIDAVYPAGAEGLVGDLAVPWVRVHNTGNVPLTDIRITSSTGEAGSIIARIDPGHQVVARNRNELGRILSTSDVETGHWSPVHTAIASSAVGEVSTSAPLPPLALS